MAKKHWITLKRGLSEDPKHREQMGMAIWGFLHMIDRADWETGTVYDWRDKDEASDMGLNERTLRDWRQRLIEKGYISCKQNRRGLEIKIFNWINPKDYSGGIINPKGDTSMSPTQNKGDIEVDTQGDTEVRRENVIPSLDSKVKDQKPKEGASANPKKTPKPSEPKASDIPELVLFREVALHWPKPGQRDLVIGHLQQVRSRLGRDVTAADLTPWWKAWMGKSGNEWNLTWLEWAAAGRVLPYGGAKGNFTPAPQSPAPAQYSAGDRAAAEAVLARRAGGGA